MTIEDFLLPGENILYRSQGEVKYQGDTYRLCLTDRRIMWYKRKGLLLKSDKVITERMGEVREIHYEERGIVSRQGVIRIVTPSKIIEFSGSRSVMRDIYTFLQTFIGAPK